MKKRNTVLAGILAIGMALSLAACGSSAGSSSSAGAASASASASAASEEAESAASEAPAADDGEQKFIGISFPSTLVDRWPAEAEYLKAGLEDLGYKAEIQYADEDASKQNNQIENFITQGADMVVVCAVDTTTLGQTAAKAQEEGVTIVSYCRMLSGMTPDFFAGEDNSMVGVMQAQYVLDNVDSGNIIVIGGSPTDTNGILYHDTAMETIQDKVDSGDYNIVLDQMCEGWDPAQSLANVENALSQCDNDVAAVICPNDGLAGGAVEALTAQGLDGDVVVTGGDGELAAAKRILAGTQSMTVFKDSKVIAQAAIDAIDNYFKTGEKPSGTTSNDVDDAIPAALADMTVVTKDNIQEVFVDGGVFTAEDLGI